MSKPLRFFIAGIIQGSLPDAIHPQDYRGEIGSLLKTAFPESEVFDPVARYPDSLSYDDKTASEAFFNLMDLAGRTDVLVAVIPEASMGTAIELWNAHRAGAFVLSVTPLERNWAIRFLSDAVVASVAELRRFIAGGELGRRLAEKQKETQCPQPIGSSSDSASYSPCSTSR